MSGFGAELRSRVEVYAELPGFLVVAASSVDFGYSPSAYTFGVDLGWFQYQCRSSAFGAEFSVQTAPV